MYELLPLLPLKIDSKNHVFCTHLEHVLHLVSRLIDSPFALDICLEA